MSKSAKELIKGVYYLAINKKENKMYVGEYKNTGVNVNFGTDRFEIYIEGSNLIKGPRFSYLRGSGSRYVFYPIDINEVNQHMEILDDSLNRDISLALHNKNIPNNLSREIYSYLGPNASAPYAVTEYRDDPSEITYTFEKQTKGGKKSRQKNKRKRRKTNKSKINT
jgi:hypothetical protein